MSDPEFKFCIDESGEAGIEKVRSEKSQGASPYMTLGGGFIRNEFADDIIQELDVLKAKFNKDILHCNRLKHEQKVKFAKVIGVQKLRLFGLISKKSTLGNYKQKIQSSHSQFYNKCAQYLLERLGLFMQTNEIKPDQVEIIFEEGNFDYSALKSLIKKCQANPMYGHSKFLKNIDSELITFKPKVEEPLLQIADLVAHSLYKCVDKSEKNYGVTETRYLNELKKVFFRNENTGIINNFGIKAVHHIGQLQLDPQTGQFLKELNAID